MRTNQSAKGQRDAKRLAINRSSNVSFQKINMPSESRFRAFNQIKVNGMEEIEKRRSASSNQVRGSVIRLKQHIFGADPTVPITTAVMNNPTDKVRRRRW